MVCCSDFLKNMLWRGEETKDKEIVRLKILYMVLQDCTFIDLHIQVNSSCAWENFLCESTSNKVNWSMEFSLMTSKFSIFDFCREFVVLSSDFSFTKRESFILSYEMERFGKRLIQWYFTVAGDARVVCVNGWEPLSNDGTKYPPVHDKIWWENPSDDAFYED